MKIYLLWLIVALIALFQVGDWLTTRRVIAQGGREENPFMVRLIAWVGLDAAFAVKGAGITALGVLIALYHLTISALIYDGLICGLYAYVVWHNWKQIR